MPTSPKKLLVLQVAALGFEFLSGHYGNRRDDLLFKPIDAVFPAVTCTAQASMRTAAAPSAHGMIANGLYHRALRKPLFWEQAAAQVEGRRWWDGFRDDGGTVGMLFWQQSLGERADVVLSPAPIHKHHGGMIQDCYSLPRGLYDRLRATLKRPFNLHRYWGPMASEASSQWIAEAVAALVRDGDAPDVCLAYLPGLDYNLQRYGPDDKRSARSLGRVLAQIDLVTRAAAEAGYAMLIFGDYAIAPCPGGAVFPNRALHAAGLMDVREVKGRAYPDLYASRAFAVVDHEVGHVYIHSAGDIDAARRALAAVDGIERVLDRDDRKAWGVDHPNAGELVIVASEGHWLAYPWWTDPRREPDYARHVDIHNKPGFDPCELFFGWPPMSVSRDTTRIRGSHGRTGPGREVAWAARGFEPADDPATLIELASSIEPWLTSS
jgi:predicted AlkP superfamily pyrophosphatase or phosphodiesterase